MTTVLRASTFILLGVTAAGCGLEGVVLACDSGAVPGIVATVVDARTRRMVQGEIFAVAASTDFSDTVRVVADSTAAPLQLAHERAGIYTLRIEVAACKPWQKFDVRVERADRCHVRSTDILAELDPR